MITILEGFSTAISLPQKVDLCVAALAKAAARRDGSVSPDMRVVLSTATLDADVERPFRRCFGPEHVHRFELCNCGCGFDRLFWILRN